VLDNRGVVVTLVSDILLTHMSISLQLQCDTFHYCYSKFFTTEEFTTISRSLALTGNTFETYVLHTER